MHGSAIEGDSKHSLFFSIPNGVIRRVCVTADDGKSELLCRAYYPAAGLFGGMGGMAPYAIPVLQSVSGLVIAAPVGMAPVE
jgi:hypothetical protein